MKPCERGRSHSRFCSLLNLACMSPVATSSCRITRVSWCGWPLENARLPRKHVCRTSGQTLAKSSNRSVWNGGVAISPKFGRIAPVLPNWHRSGAPVPSPPRQIHWHNRRHATLLPGVSFLPRADAVPTPARAPMISRALAARGCSWRCFALSCAKACHGTRQMLENGRGGPARIDRTLRLRRKWTNAQN
jgi:hypothetical protein